MSDNELDDLFKEAAEGFKPPPDASAWEQMAARLDQAAPVSGFWNWKTISALTVTGIIAITATWYALTPQQESITKNDTEYGSNNASQGVVQEQKEQTHKPGKENLAPAESVENKSDGDGSVKVTPEKIKKSFKPAAKQGQQKLNLSDSKAGGNTFVLNESSTNEADQSDETIKVIPVSERSVTNLLSAKRNASPEETQPVKLRDSVLAVNVIVKTDSVQSSDQSKKDSEKDKARSKSGFSVKLAVSPDFSSVNYFSASKSGINYGVLVGYSFNKRWSVYTGVISSKKLYTSKDIEKSYASGGHNYPVKELDGDCRIIDIPVNVYYSFFPERSFSLKVGLGFSSYLMRKETYNYCVDNYGTDAFYEQRIKGENNEWFKILNFSFIAEKKLTNRLSAEFEPFVKAPLAGVGEGKVSLVSMGAFINLKFDLSTNK